MLGAAALGVGGIISSLVSNQVNQQVNDRAFNQSAYQYEDAKKYNSAYQQVMRLRAAGINPAFAFGQNAGQAVGQSVPSPIPQMPLDLSGLANIAQGISMNDVNRARTLSEERLNVVKADSQQFDLALNQLFGAKERSASLSHTMADASRLFQQTQLFKEQGNTEKAEQTYLAFQAALADITAKLTGKQKEYVEKELEWYDAKARQGLAVGRSEVMRNQASAAESNARAITENTLRDFRKSLLSDASDVSSSTKVERINNMLAAIDASTELSKAEKADATTRLQRALELVRQRNNSELTRWTDDFLYWITQHFKMSASVHGGYDFKHHYGLDND